MDKFSSLAEYNLDVHRTKGIGNWRELYRAILERVDLASIMELGCGSPEFLQKLSHFKRRIALDGGDRYRDEFTNRASSFIKLTLTMTIYRTLLTLKWSFALTFLNTCNFQIARWLTPENPWRRTAF